MRSQLSGNRQRRLVSPHGGEPPAQKKRGGSWHPTPQPHVHKVEFVQACSYPVLIDALRYWQATEVVTAGVQPCRTESATWQGAGKNGTHRLAFKVPSIALVGKRAENSVPLAPKKPYPAPGLPDKEHVAAFASKKQVIANQKHTPQSLAAWQADERRAVAEAAAGGGVLAQQPQPASLMGPSPRPWGCRCS